jgi:hypothetical protein
MTGEISWLHSGKAFYCHFIIVTLFLSHVVGLMDPICKTIFFSLSRNTRPDWLIFAGQIDLSIFLYFPIKLSVTFLQSYFLEVILINQSI